MLQTVATLVFLLLAGAGVAVIVASLLDDWAVLCQALGFGRTGNVAPLPPRTRAPGPLKTARLVRFSPSSAHRAAA